MENAILPLVLGVAVIVLGIGLVVLVRRWSDVPARTSAMPGAPPPSERLAADDELHAFLARGQKIQAIKRVRAVTGMGLKEAKAYVEALPDAPRLDEHTTVRQTPPLNRD